jgi:hypothetical protein
LAIYGEKLVNTRYIVTFLLTLILAGPACSLTDPQGSQSAILFVDDFSDTNKKWNRVSADAGSADYYNDTYRIMVNQADAQVWANPGNESFMDTHIEVDAVKNSGPDDNDFGIICRYEGESQFYFAVISSDGYYGILKMTYGGVKIIGKDNLLENSAINQGAVSNHLRFDCIGSTLSLYANGSLLDQQTDTDYTTGNIGLLAGSFSVTGTDILFDNFVVYKP